MICTDFYVSGEQFELFRCETCNFTFTQGVPLGEDIDRYYQTPDYISHSDTNKGITNALYHSVRKHMLGKKARLVSRESHLKSGKILDIGTGTGYFPAAMQKRGWVVEAVEKNPQAREVAKKKFGLNVKDNSALKQYKRETFDVITMWHVMEHVDNLYETWMHLYDLLTERGVVIIAVPNIASYDANKYKEYWAAYDVPRHIWHYTPATIQQMASAHGFIMAARHPMPFDAFYVSILSEKNRKKSFPFFRGMVTGTQAWFNTIGSREKSSSMIYVFRKKRYEK